MIFGLVWATVLNLPALFAEWFGMERLSEHADRLFKPQPFHPDLAHWNHSGERLMFLCNLFVWIGLTMFALGWWRQVNATPSGRNPTAPP
jgi:hypothetical protein